MLTDVLNKVIDWLTSTSLYKKIASTIIAHVTFRYYKYPWLAQHMDTQFTVMDAVNTHQQENPYFAYAFVLLDKKSLAAKLITSIAKQRFTHAGLLDPNKSYSDFRTIHMKGDGLHIDHISTPMAQADVIVIIGFDLQNEQNYNEYQNRIEYMYENQGKFEYDYAMNLKDGLLNIYCSELVYEAIDDLVDTKTIITRGKENYGPDQVFNQGKVIIYCGDEHSGS